MTQGHLSVLLLLIDLQLQWSYFVARDLFYNLTTSSPLTKGQGPCSMAYDGTCHGKKWHMMVYDVDLHTLVTIDDGGINFSPKITVRWE